MMPAGGSRFIVRFMKTLLFGLVLLSSTVFAEPMPPYTPQYNAAQAVISAVRGFQFDCPADLLSNPELEVDYTYQVVCGASDFGTDMMRSALDLQLTDYEPVNAWSFVEDGKNALFKRMYKLDPGALIVNLSDSNSGGGLIVIEYAEPRK